MKAPNLVIDYDRLRQINEDFIAWLYFPALDISYPVVQEDETNEYLKKTYGGQTNRAGAIYMDNVSDPSFNGLTDFIFGHNMANETMFGKLRNLNKDDGGSLIAEKPYIFIYTEERIIAYEIFAFFKTDVRSDVYNKVETDADYEKFLRIVLNYNQYEEARIMDFSQRPEILTLSTCSGSAGTKQRFLVCTMKLREWEP
jgi:sortase B